MLKRFGRSGADRGFFQANFTVCHTQEAGRLVVAENFVETEKTFQPEMAPENVGVGNMFKTLAERTTSNGPFWDRLRLCETKTEHDIKTLWIFSSSTRPTTNPITLTQKWSIAKWYEKCERACFSVYSSSSRRWTWTSTTRLTLLDLCVSSLRRPWLPRGIRWAEVAPPDHAPAPQNHTEA